MASAKQMKLQTKDRHGYMVGLKDVDVWGPAYFTIKMKEMAARCSFTNPTRCTGKVKRSEGISRMVNSKDGIPITESMRAS